MKLVCKTYQDDPKLIDQYLGILGKVYSKESDAHQVTGPDIKLDDQYIIGIDDASKIVGGVKLETTKNYHENPLHFQRKEVFDTLRLNFPFLDWDKLQIADLSHLSVASENQKGGVGLKLMQEAFRRSAEQHTDITFMWPNKTNTASTFFSKVKDNAGFPAYTIGYVDLITDNWDRLRNTKELVAIVHNPELAQQFESYKNGNLPWQPNLGNSAVYASPYGKNAGVDGVILDWDNVMVDDVPLWASAISQTLRELKSKGHIIPSDLRCTHSQHPLQYLKTVLGDDVGEEAYPMLMANVEKLMPQVLELKPGALRTIQLLKRNHIPFGFVSNSQEDRLKKQIRFTLGPEFENVPAIGSAKKPMPDNIHAMLNTLKLKPSSKVYLVGDSGDTDIRGALNAGIRPVLFSTADLNIVNELSNERCTTTVGFVRDHIDLQRFVAAQMRQGLASAVSR